MPKSPAKFLTLADVFADSPTRTYGPGQLILHAGDPLNNTYYIAKGYTKVYDIIDNGESRIVLINGPGDIFPVATLLSRANQKTLFYHETFTHVSLKVMKRNKFDELIAQEPAATRILLRYFSRAQQKMLQRLQGAGNRMASGKVAKIFPYLIEQCGHQVDMDRFAILKVTHQDIADLTGLTRETVSTQIKALEKKGLLEQRKGYYLIDKSLSQF